VIVIFSLKIRFSGDVKNSAMRELEIGKRKKGRGSLAASSCGLKKDYPCSGCLEKLPDPSII